MLNIKNIIITIQITGQNIIKNIVASLSSSASISKTLVYPIAKYTQNKQMINIIPVIFYFINLNVSFNSYFSLLYIGVT